MANLAVGVFLLFLRYACLPGILGAYGASRLRLSEKTP